MDIRFGERLHAFLKRYASLALLLVRDVAARNRHHPRRLERADPLLDIAEEASACAALRTAAGFYLAAYANDVMQYHNSIPIYTAFALCFAGPYIDKRMQQSKETELKNEQ